MDQQTLFSLLVDLHRVGTRQGPGSVSETLRALELTRCDVNASLSVADVGCGTGASALVLANKLPNATITAVDLFPEFLEVLTDRAIAAGCEQRITTLSASMDSLPFLEESLDLIWSEGAIYNIGFRRGIKAWRRLLKSGGVLAVSEITWLRPNPPIEIFEHWNSEYSEIATAAEKINILEKVGYELVGFFLLPASSWFDYYEPLEQRIAYFLERHAYGSDALKVAEMERHEAELYRRYQDWFSYGFYIARKPR